MNWEDLEAKHVKQWAEFNSARDQEYEAMEERHRELHEAFFDNSLDKPLIIKERMRMEYDAWYNKWDNNGQTMTELKERQQKEIRDWIEVEKFKDQLNDIRHRENSHDRDR